MKSPTSLPTSLHWPWIRLCCNWGWDSHALPWLPLTTYYFFSLKLIFKGDKECTTVQSHLLFLCSVISAPTGWGNTFLCKSNDVKVPSVLLCPHSPCSPFLSKHLCTYKHLKRIIYFTEFAYNFCCSASWEEDSKCPSNFSEIIFCVLVNANTYRITWWKIA